MYVGSVRVRRHVCRRRQQLHVRLSARKDRTHLSDRFVIFHTKLIFFFTHLQVAEKHVFARRCVLLSLFFLAGFIRLERGKFFCFLERNVSTIKLKPKRRKTWREHSMPPFLCAVLGEEGAPAGCVFERRLYAHQSSWDHQCNSCTCSNGSVHCSKVRVESARRPPCSGEMNENGSGTNFKFESIIFK